jgi:PAS domain S-box-containing protein
MTTSPYKKNPLPQGAFSIVFYYALFGASWIFFSDSLVAQLIDDKHLIARVSMFKGWLFIAVTSLLLAVLIRLRLRVLDEARQICSGAELQLRNTIELAVDGIFFGDKDGRIIGVNSRACEMTGYDREELIGRGMDELFSRDELQRAPLRYDLLLEGKTITTERLLTGKDGAEITVEMRSKRMPDGTYQSFMRDISERRQAEDLLRASEEQVHQLNEDLEKMVAERTEELQMALRQMESFSYSISHDLRAPLRAIDGFVQILREECSEAQSPQSQRLMARISHNARHMGALIDDLLLFSRLGRQPINRQTLYPGKLVMAVLEDFTADIEQRGIDIVITQLPVCQADPLLLRQVFANLIGNAVKFTLNTPAPRIEIGSRMENGTPVYFVRDNGAGFDMAYADKLFGVFQRLHTQEEFEGTGVGLAIVQSIIQRHGGQIWAEGAIGQGATFFFTL